MIDGKSVGNTTIFTNSSGNSFMVTEYFILPQAGKCSPRTPNNNAMFLADGESLVCRVATAAVLTTTYTFKVWVRGVYLG